jgi:copper transport protein
MTGIAQSIIEVGTLSELTGTAYGRLILAKSALLLCVVGVAAFSRRLVGRISTAEEAAVKPSARLLRRTVVGELAVTGVVLALAAALVQSPPARSSETTSVQQPITATLTSDLYTVRVELSPGRVGGNTLHLYAYDRNGSAPQKVLQWTVTTAPVDGSVDPLAVPTLALGTDHATSEPTFPSAGAWDLWITLRVSDVDQATVSDRFTIKDA